MTSPLATPFMPNRKTLTSYFRPRPVQLPPGKPRQIVFTFAALTALQTDEVSWPFDHDFVLWAMSGNYVNATPDTLGFRLQLTHTTQGKTRPLFNKHIPHVNVLGSGQLPFLLRQTYLFQQGDSLLCEVKNMSQAALTSRCEVVLWGTDIE